MMCDQRLKAFGPTVRMPLIEWGGRDTALQQIKDRDYGLILADYTGEILLVGVNYDKDDRNKPHSCVIQRYVR